MTIDEARSSALAAHPDWPSQDIENLARGMVAKSARLALLDQLEREVAEFDAAEAERHEEWKRENPDGSLLGVIGGIGWGTNERDAALWADLEERSEGANASSFDYERDVLAPAQKVQAEFIAKQQSTGWGAYEDVRPSASSTSPDEPPKPGSAAAIRDRLLSMPLPES